MTISSVPARKALAVLITAAILCGAGGAAALAQSGPMDMSGSEMGGVAARVAERVTAFWTKASPIFQNAPSAPAEWLAAMGRVLRQREGQFPAAPVLAAAILLTFVIHATNPLALRLTHKYRSRAATPFSAALRRIGAELLGLAMGFGVTVAGAATLFAGKSPAPLLSVGLLWAVVLWRVALTLVRVMFRPRRPDLRLLPVDTPAARAIVWRAGIAFALAITFQQVVYVFIDHGLPLPSAQIAALGVGTLSALFLLAAVVRDSEANAQVRGRVLLIGSIITLSFWAVWCGAVVTLDFTVYDVFLHTIEAAYVLLVVVRLLELAKPRAPAEGTAGGIIVEPVERRRGAAVIQPIQRSLYAVAGAATLIVYGEIVTVQLLGLFSPARWEEIARALVVGLSVLVTGYVLYEMLRAWAAADGMKQGELSVEDAEEVRPQSRLSTVMPLLSGAVLVTTTLIAGLITLSELGVNTAPLLAGAGIFGLAISFGSQTLVKDIVSGIFYMADDAFRVGEYIETGRLKGTVEKILIRSLRMRHQNGQIHTVPFGQMGAVTNFSRDWSTIKFNLRFARDSDLEKIRKTAKQTGIALLEDEEVGPEFIQPLKLQGVVDVLENALVCRFKFTVRPLKPTLVQRMVLKRLYAALLEKGVAFASNTVTVQTSNGAGDPEVVSQVAAMSRLTAAGPTPLARADEAA